MQNTESTSRNAAAAGSIVKYKIVFLGDQSVGKTSIISRFIHDSFDGKEHPTVGIDFLSKTLYFDDRTIRLQLWDTAGQERFRSLIPSYIRDSSVAVIVYDISNPNSFQNIPKWIEFVKEERGSDVLIVLVANKSDMIDRRQVTKEEGENYSKENQLIFTEVSAKTGDNIANLFKTIVNTLGSLDASNSLRSSRIVIQNPASSSPQELNTENKNSNCNC